MPPRNVSNLLLLRLSEADFGAIRPLLRHVELRVNQELITPGKLISCVYFIESGLASVTVEAQGSESIEVGMIGREGMTHQVLKQGDTSALRCFVQMEGTALAIEADDYVGWIANRPLAMTVFIRYLQATAVQLSFTALSHGSFTIEERLARWLLMCFDRSDGAEVPLVHHFLAMMLAVRRSGVTTAIHVLEGQGAIKATRGKIQLKDRASLEYLAAGAYGVPEREYDRLLGPIGAQF